MSFQTSPPTSVGNLEDTGIQDRWRHPQKQNKRGHENCNLIFTHDCLGSCGNDIVSPGDGSWQVPEVIYQSTGAWMMQVGRNLTDIGSIA